MKSFKNGENILVQASIENRVCYYASCPDSDLIKLPAAKDDVMDHIKNHCIGSDTDLTCLEHSLSNYESMDELNYLAALINDLHIWEHLHPTKTLTFYAAIQYGKHIGSVKELINLLHNLDCYYLYDDATDEESLGRFCAEDLEWIEIPEELEDSFDYDAYGQELCLELDGEFVESGYIVYEGGFVEHYKGVHDLPEEYRSNACLDQQKASV